MGQHLTRKIVANLYYSEGNLKKAEQYNKLENPDEPEEEYDGAIDKIMKLFSKK